MRARGGEPPSYTPSPREDAAIDAGWRFSLAGVQLKFSMKRDGDRLTMPGRDDRGEWIVKVALRELARRLGQPPEEAEEIVTGTTARIAAAWAEVREDVAVTDAYRTAMRRHWQKVPLLQPYASHF